METLFIRHSLRKAKQITAIAMLSAILSACGGGGGGSSSTSSNPPTTVCDTECTVLKLSTSLDSAPAAPGAEATFLTSLPAAVL